MLNSLVGGLFVVTHIGRPPHSPSITASRYRTANNARLLSIPVAGSIPRSAGPAGTPPPYARRAAAVVGWPRQGAMYASGHECHPTDGLVVFAAHARSEFRSIRCAMEGRAPSRGCPPAAGAADASPSHRGEERREVSIPGIDTWQERSKPGSDQRDRGIPEHRRPRPAPRPQVKVSLPLPAREREGHRHPHRPRHYHHGQRPRLNSRNTVNPTGRRHAGPWTRPPRHDTPHSSMPD